MRRTYCYSARPEPVVVAQEIPKSCGTDRQIAPNKKPRRPRSTGLSYVEAEAGIEPAWADLQATRKNYYFQTVTRVFLRALVIGSTLKSLV